MLQARSVTPVEVDTAIMEERPTVLPTPNAVARIMLLIMGTAAIDSNFDAGVIYFLHR
jgi:hypothetical protein